MDCPKIWKRHIWVPTVRQYKPLKETWRESKAKKKQKGWDVTADDIKETHETLSNRPYNDSLCAVFIPEGAKTKADYSYDLYSVKTVHPSLSQHTLFTERRIFHRTRRKMPSLAVSLLGKGGKRNRYLYIVIFIQQQQWWAIILTFNRNVSLSWQNGSLPQLPKL